MKEEPPAGGSPTCATHVTCPVCSAGARCRSPLALCASAQKDAQRRCNKQRTLEHAAACRHLAEPITLHYTTPAGAQRAYRRRRTEQQHMCPRSTTPARTARTRRPLRMRRRPCPSRL